MAPGVSAAFVLGAGLGTRLRPLTDEKPKPLIPIFGKPLVTFALDHLAALGVRRFVINTHHLAGQFDEMFAGSDVRLVYEPVLLETGGGIKNAESLIGDGTFIVYSGDVLTDLDLEALVEEHFRRGNDVTLALRDTGLASGVALRDGKIAGFRDVPAGFPRHDFANVSVWNRGIFSRITAGRKISFIPVLADWIKEGGKVGGLLLNGRSWFNIGSRREYLEAHNAILRDSWRPSYLDAPDWPRSIDPTARIAPDAKLEGFNVIGPGCEIGAGAHLKNCILWKGAKIASRSILENCIVRQDRLAEGTLRAVDV